MSKPHGTRHTTGRRPVRSWGGSSSSFVRHHINMLGRYSFRLPDLPGGLRPLRDKDDADE
ncbi:hypothetical protein [Streptomyces sp. NPDC002588]|uniref:hypothetical protein n=1 Tax=Streptomyces sp. NPDC002588 TaxID=3154419 RepID=UPI00332F79A8